LKAGCRELLPFSKPWEFASFVSIYYSIWCSGVMLHF